VLVEALAASETVACLVHPASTSDRDRPGPWSTNVLAARVLGGGSATLTQAAGPPAFILEQVAQGTLVRKWRDIARCPASWTRVSASQILLLSYLNRVYPGVGWASKMPPARFF